MSGLTVRAQPGERPARPGGGSVRSAGGETLRRPPHRLPRPRSPGRRHSAQPHPCSRSSLPCCRSSSSPGPRRPRGPRPCRPSSGRGPCQVPGAPTSQQFKLVSFDKHTGGKNQIFVTNLSEYLQFDVRFWLIGRYKTYLYGYVLVCLYNILCILV